MRWVHPLLVSGSKGWACAASEAAELTVAFPAYEQRYVWWVEARNYYGYSGHEQMVVTVKPPGTSSVPKATRE